MHRNTDSYNITFDTYFEVRQNQLSFTNFAQHIARLNSAHEYSFIGLKPTTSSVQRKAIGNAN